MVVRVRFAPSPSGHLHIGGVRTALFNWLWARKTGGTFVLRIEDTDQERSTPASTAIILEAMRWLGLDWDEGPYTQMTRLALYREAAERLVASGKAYRCYCTVAELDAQRAAFTGAGFKYPGTCRGRRDEPDRPYAIRLATEPTGTITYTDLVFGEVTTPNIELQDFVLVRSDGVPLYNFGCVVDDAAMAITVVARGRDHMANTPQQILLYRALDAAVPAFAHLPMLLAPGGEPLSKRRGAESVTEYRDRGCAPDAVLNYLARLGWSNGNTEIFSRAELIAAFDWSGCSSSDCEINPGKLLATNHAHLKSAALVGDAEYAERVAPFVAARGITATPAAIERAVFAIRERAETFVQAADLLDPLLRDSPVIDAAAAAKHLGPASLPKLRALRLALADCDSWLARDLEACIAEAGLSLKDVGQPARVALTGRTASPSLFDVLVLLGRDVALARLDRAVS